MANGLNKGMFLGNLGEDPILRVTAGGQSVMTFSLACNESYLDKNRQRVERVEWVRCVVWGRRAEALAKFLKKGAKVFVEGRLQNSSYENREGIKRYKTEVVAENLILGGSNNPRSKPDDPERERPSRREHYDDKDQQPAGAGGGGASHEGNGWGNDDDQIPF